jgi:excisionase family DNA binding protein
MCEFLTVSRAAKVVSLSPARVRQLLREERLQGIRPGGRGSWRISTDSLQRYLGEPPARQAQA